MGKVFDLQEAFTSLNHRLDSINQRLDGIEHRLDGVEHRLDRVESRLDGVEHRLDALETRVDNLEKNVQIIRMTLENETNPNICIVAEGHLDLSRKLDKVISQEEDYEVMRIRVNHLESEMEKLRA